MATVASSAGERKSAVTMAVSTAAKVVLTRQMDPRRASVSSREGRGAVQHRCERQGGGNAHSGVGDGRGEVDSIDCLVSCS